MGLLTQNNTVINMDIAMVSGRVALTEAITKSMISTLETTNVLTQDTQSIWASTMISSTATATATKLVLTTVTMATRSVPTFMGWMTDTTRIDCLAEAKMQIRTEAGATQTLPPILDIETDCRQHDRMFEITKTFIQIITTHMKTPTTGIAAIMAIRTRTSGNTERVLFKAIRMSDHEQYRRALTADLLYV